MVRFSTRAKCLGTIFAYGQTGCGKTHTMMGNLDSTRVGEAGEVDLPEEAGILPRSFAHLFSALKSKSNSTVRYLIRCSFIEIYNEELRDLLAAGDTGKDSTAKKKKLEIKETAEG